MGPHPHLTRLPDAEWRAQITDTQQVVDQITGTAPCLFRPPNGNVNGDIAAFAASQGLRPVL